MLTIIFSDVSYIIKIMLYICCCLNETTMDTYCNASAVNELASNDDKRNFIYRQLHKYIY